MSWFKRSPVKPAPLVGKWRTDASDTAAVETYGDVSMEFDDAGNLTYVIHGEDKDEIILMTYTVDGGTITTDQPSHPSPNTTDYAIAGDVLTLSLDGLSARFVRA